MLLTIQNENNVIKTFKYRAIKHYLSVFCVFAGMGSSLSAPLASMRFIKALTSAGSPKVLVAIWRSSVAAYGFWNRDPPPHSLESGD